MGFINSLKENKAEIFIIGGAIRNLLYNKIHGTNFKYKDLDFIVRLIDINQLCILLRKFGTVKEVGKSFGVIKFKEIGKKYEYDIALPRSEISTGTGHKDFLIMSDHNTELKYDCSRRDATINAIALELVSDEDLNNLGTIINQENRIRDYYDGISDIKNKLWRAIGDPEERFKEDNLRILRAIRQAAELGLIIEYNTKKSINKNYRLIEIIKKESPVRVANELVRLACTNDITYLFDFKVADICDIKKDTSALFVGLAETEPKIRMALLLDAHNNKYINEWVKTYQLSAAPNYSCKEVDFLDCCHNFYKHIYDLNDKYSMRKFIQILEDKYKNKGLNYSKSLIKYFMIIERIVSDRLLSLYEDNKNIILTTNHVKIDGNTLMDMGIVAREIKKIKLQLLDLITEDKLENNREIILEYLNKKLKIKNS